MITRDTLRRRLELDDHSLIEIGRTVETQGSMAVETIRFQTRSGEAVRGLVTRPTEAGPPRPAILYIHAHGNRYDIGADELMAGRRALQSPYGPLLAAEGFVTLVIDLPCFGERATVSEASAAKAALWQGRSLAGQMLGELASALTWLAARSDVDATRIGAYGISMGATFAYWLAAADPRIAAVAHQCCYADFATLIETGAHDLHGIYLTVPGLLAETDMGTIAGLIAPRPQLICIGDLDPLTPPLAVNRALIQTRAAYVASQDALILHRELDTGHSESADMRRVTLAFLRETLTPVC